MNTDSYQRAEIGKADFDRLSNFIQTNYGIKMPPEKKVLMEGRLQKRLRANGFDSFSAYCAYLFSGEGKNEILHLIDAISTNTTHFFRESDHFDYLQSDILPEFENQGGNFLKVWSAAASSGEEIYTTAIAIEEYKRKNGAGLDYSILGTDISTRILEKAINAIYPEERLAAMPVELKKEYFQRSKDRTKRLVKVGPKIGRKTQFQRLNLMDSNYNVPTDFDVIFCRNVLIYFEREVQEAVIAKLCEHLTSGGYLLLGHSESIMGRKFPLRTIKPTIYQKL